MASTRKVKGSHPAPALRSSFPLSLFLLGRALGWGPPRSWASPRSEPRPTGLWCGAGPGSQPSCDVLAWTPWGRQVSEALPVNSDLEDGSSAPHTMLGLRLPGATDVRVLGHLAAPCTATPEQGAGLCGWHLAGRMTGWPCPWSCCYSPCQLFCAHCSLAGRPMLACSLLSFLSLLCMRGVLCRVRGAGIGNELTGTGGLCCTLKEGF